MLFSNGLSDVLDDKKLGATVKMLCPYSENYPNPSELIVEVCNTINNTNGKCSGDNTTAVVARLYPKKKE